MRELLFTLAILGGWNLLNALARLVYKAPQDHKFWPYIVFGAWAAYLLITGGC